MTDLKKFAIAVAFGAAVTFGNFQTGFAYPKPVAVITNYEEVASGISIQRANGTPNGSDAFLYPGDTITGNVNYVQIKCGPYANFQTRNGAYVIFYNPPSGIRGVAQNVIDYASSFWNNVESVVAGVSRGSEDELNLNPQPGFDVTLLTSQKVRFSWENPSTGNFFIQNENGKKIFEKKLNNAKEIDVDLKKIKVKAGEKYIWSVDNLGEYKFSVLDKQTEKDIIEKLAEIDAENISGEERILKKAAYVQLISDIYPDKIDLYWLSSQWLSEISPDSEKLKEDKFVLLKKCSQHLDEEM